MSANFDEGKHSAAERHDYTTPPQSPDLIPAHPKRGPGVRRMNKRPAMIAFAFVAVGLLGLSLAYMGRIEDTQVQQRSQDEDTKIAPVNQRVLFSDAPAYGAAPDRTAQKPAPTPASTPTQRVATHSPQPNASQPTGQPQAEAPKEDPLVAQLRMIAVEQYKRGVQARDEAKRAQSNVSGNGDGEAEQRQSTQQAILAALKPASGDSSSPARPPLGIGAGAASVGAGRTGPDASDPNRQGEKVAFLSGAGSSADYLGNTRTAPLGQYEVKAGTVIPSILITGVNSDLPGQMIAQVQETVYSHVDAYMPVIPKGARLVGRYDSSLAMGQSRVLVAWNRIIYPDGSSINIEAMPGADSEGYAGFHDLVDNHYLRLFGSAVFLSAFTAGVQLSQPQQKGDSNGYSSQQIIAGSLGQQMGQLGMEMTRRNMQIQPTLEIRPGYEFNIMVNKDIILPPWSAAR